MKFSDEEGKNVVSDAEIRIPAYSSHQYENTVTAPTCTEKGYTTHTCKRCGDTYKDAETAALGHDFSDDRTFDGTSHWHACSRCGAKSGVEAHKFGDWVHTGSHTHECTACGYKETEECAFGDWTVTKQPTAKAKGEKQRTCTKCAYVEKVEIAATGTTEPDSGNTSKPDSGSPKTGDSSQTSLWIVLMLAAAGSALGVIRKRKGADK